VDVPSSVSISGSKSVLCCLSWAKASSIKNSAEERDVCEYAYPASELTIWVHSAPELSPVGAGGISGGGGVSSAVGCLCLSGEDAPGPVRLHRVGGFLGVPFQQERHPAIWF